MGPESLKVAEKARDRIEIIKARRGNITDARGNIVATSRPLIDLGVDQVDFKPTPENIKKLKMVAALLSMDEKLSSKNAPQKIPHRSVGRKSRTP